jgi:hypothetical protein
MMGHTEFGSDTFQKTSLGRPRSKRKGYIKLNLAADKWNYFNLHLKVGFHVSSAES